MIRVYSVSLGCPKNRVDTERALGGLGATTPAAEPEQADLVFVNTCGFIAPAVEESVRTLLELEARLAAMPKGKRPLFVLAGCLVGRYGKKTLAPDLPEVDLILESADLEHWAGHMRKALGLADQPPGRLLSTGPSYAWLKISEGCRHKCAFCTIPSIRGALSSYPAEALAQEAAHLLEQGVKELIVVAQDTTAWGRDFTPKQRLQTLLEKLLPLPGLAWLRLMYLYPAGLDDELLGFLQQAGPPFIPYFDVPVQHAAKGVLSRMGRPFAQNPAEALVRIRKYFPGAALRTSIIVGFPGETEKDFETLCRFVQEARFHHLGVFTYFAEQGTPAAAMPGQIDEATKTWRKNTLMALQREISAEILASYVGLRLPVLVDAASEEWPGLHLGRTWFQVPEIDGLTYISGPKVAPGRLVTAEITESSEYDLVSLA